MGWCIAGQFSGQPVFSFFFSLKQMLYQIRLEKTVLLTHVPKLNSNGCQKSKTVAQFHLPTIRNSIQRLPLRLSLQLPICQPLFFNLALTRKCQYEQQLQEHFHLIQRFYHLLFHLAGELSRCGVVMQQHWIYRYLFIAKLANCCMTT